MIIEVSKLTSFAAGIHALNSSGTNLQKKWEMINYSNDSKSHNELLKTIACR